MTSFTIKGTGDYKIRYRNVHNIVTLKCITNIMCSDLVDKIAHTLMNEVPPDPV